MKYIFKKEYNVFVHMDLALSNSIMTDKGIVPIDFQLSGIGNLYFDLVSILSQINDEKFRNKVVEGYSSVSNVKVNREYIDHFFKCGYMMYKLTRR